jgi:cephalosporin hydroxylase
MHKNKEFLQEVARNIERLSDDRDVQALGRIFIREVSAYKYAYNFSWMGRPIIQFPQDMMAMQEIIWQVKPDLIIETGIAHGGSLILSASILELIGDDGQVLGIDIDIRPHNREAIESHPLFKRIELIEGSSISDEVLEKVREIARDKKNILVILDSNHTHEHVLRELELYSPMVAVGSYCIVFDTVIEDMREDSFPNRPWNKTDNPKTAVREFLHHNDNFQNEASIQNKLLITVAPDGYLKRIK